MGREKVVVEGVVVIVVVVVVVDAVVVFGCLGFGFALDFACFSDLVDGGFFGGSCVSGTGTGLSTRICLTFSISVFLFSDSSNNACNRAYSTRAFPYAIFFSRNAAKSSDNLICAGTLGKPCWYWASREGDACRLNCLDEEPGRFLMGRADVPS